MEVIIVLKEIGNEGVDWIRFRTGSSGRLL
jgi:hypothetical protein